MFDYHIATALLAGWATPIERSCEATIKGDVAGTAFADHVGDVPAAPATGRSHDVRKRTSIQLVQGPPGDYLVILSCAEVDFNTRIRSQVEAFLEWHQGEHWVARSARIGDNGEPNVLWLFWNRYLNGIFMPHQEQFLAAGERGQFDTIGHIDPPGRYALASSGKYGPWGCEPHRWAVLQALIDRLNHIVVSAWGVRWQWELSVLNRHTVSPYIGTGKRMLPNGMYTDGAESADAGVPQAHAVLQISRFDKVSLFGQRQQRQIPIAGLASVATTRSS